MKYKTKKTDNPLNARVKITLKQSEKIKIKEKAKLANMNMSEYLRALINEKKIVVADQLPKLNLEILRICTNANQIVSVAEQQKNYLENQIEIDEIRKLAKEIKKIRTQILDNAFEQEEHTFQKLEEKINRLTVVFNQKYPE